MTTFVTGSFLKYDDYITPSSAWTSIKHLIPPDKIVWEPFYCDGQSGDDLRALGFEVIHEPVDFYAGARGDIVVSNPPFSDTKAILTQLVEWNKPFILILPASKITTQYFRALFAGDARLQIIIPRKRIQFTKKNTDGTLERGGRCSFDCFYFCWKIGLDKAITWLE